MDVVDRPPQPTPAAIWTEDKGWIVPVVVAADPIPARGIASMGGKRG
jgi:hypothetical protein